MIITRTPFRVSLLGGGTDFPAWYRQHGGAVLGFALDRYCWISARHLPPFFPYRYRIAYSEIELASTPRFLRHPAARAALTRYDGPAEVHHDGDLPARSGLGSSSSFTVGLLNALRALHGLEPPSARELAYEAIDLEQNVIGEAVGSQDQVWAAYGGLNRIDFDADGFKVSRLALPAGRAHELMDHLLLVFSGQSRFAVEVEERKLKKLEENAPALHALRALVDEAQAVLTEERRPLAELGELLDAAWRLKRGLATGVATDELDSVYARARAAGAVGGKVLGAGGGGFLLFVVRPNDRARVSEALRDLVQVPVGIDQHGSRVVVNEP